jgi:Flp pilus assembly protein TadG
MNRARPNSSARRRRSFSAALGRAASFVRCQTGVAVIEFALLLVPLLLIVFGIVDFGRAMNYKNELTQLANQAARYAAVNRDPNNPGNGSLHFSCAALRTYLSDPKNLDTNEIFGTSGKGTVQVTSGATVGDPVTILLKTDFDVIPFLGTEALGGQGSIKLAGNATMRLERVPSFGSASC